LETLGCERRVRWVLAEKTFFLLRFPPRRDGQGRLQTLL